MRQSSSLFAKWISRPRRPWVNRAFALACFAAPFVVAWMEGDMEWLADGGQWRALLIAPAIIAYILAVAPPLAAIESAVIASLESLLGDQAGQTRAVYEAGATALRNELAAFAGGAAASLLVNGDWVLAEFSGLSLIVLLEGMLMYGLMAVVIYGSVHSTRATGALLRQPLQVDPLDMSPFEVIGRQSLFLSLAFVGGIMLSLLLVGPAPALVLRWEFWMIYAPLVSVPVLIFFLSMLPAHRLLQSARDAELRQVLRLIRQAYAGLAREVEQGEGSAESAQRVSALAAYEARLQQARTWPYNTTMLRTLFISILLSAATALGRLAVEAFLH